MGSSYRLMGGGQSLQQYVNSRVEVTGTLQSGSSGAGRPGSTEGAGTAGAGTSTRPGSTTGSTAGSSTAGGATSRPGETGGMAGHSGSQAMQTLRVTSVKQVSGSCSGEGR
jgi:hypothetical protein